MHTFCERHVGWFVLIASSLACQVHGQEWIRQFGSDNWENTLAVAPDGGGGAFSAGSTRGDLGGPNAGWSDVFLVRHSAAGGLLWIRQIGTSDSEEGRSLAPTSEGGALIAGYTAGDLGGPSAGASDIFVARYDGLGAQIWLRQFGSSRTDDAHAIAADGMDGFFVAGNTWGDFGGTNAGFSDAFLARHDSEGNQLWIRQIGTFANDFARAVAYDGAGGVLVAGDTAGHMVGGNAGRTDVFLARYDNAGNQTWIRQFGTSLEDRPLAVAVDRTGGILVSGETEGDLGGPNAGQPDAFLARFDGGGRRLWTRQWGTAGFDAARALAVSVADKVFVAGRVSDDAFLACYDLAGSREWIDQFGTEDGEWANGLALSGGTGVLVGGWTTGDFGGPNAGGRDAFLARFGGCDPCDMNCDGEISAFDIEPFLDLLFDAGTPCDACTGDTNGDGTIDAFDIEPFLACLFP